MVLLQLQLRAAVYRRRSRRFVYGHVVKRVHARASALRAQRRCGAVVQIPARGGGGLLIAAGCRRLPSVAANGGATGASEQPRLLVPSPLRRRAASRGIGWRRFEGHGALAAGAGGSAAAGGCGAASSTRRHRAQAAANALGSLARAFERRPRASRGRATGAIAVGYTMRVEGAGGVVARGGAAAARCRHCIHASRTTGHAAGRAIATVTARNSKRGDVCSCDGGA